MSMPIQKHDLVLMSSGPRIADLLLAQRLAFEKPYNIRKLIERNKAELEGYGELPVNSLHRGEKPTRGRPGRAYLLNEGQALVLCALSRTPVAAAVRQELVRIFMLYRHDYPVLPTEMQALRDLCELAHVFSEGQRRFLLAPVTSSILDALAAFQAADEERESEEDGDDPEGDDLDEREGEFKEDLEPEDEGDPDMEKEGDPNEDREPALGWGTAPDQSRAMHCGWHNEEDEPSLGSTEAFGSQAQWGHGKGETDAEDEHDGSEPDVDAEIEHEGGDEDVAGGVI